MKKVLIITTLALVSLMQSCGNTSENEAKEIDPKKALELSKKDVLFVDVRTKGEITESDFDVKNKINIPMDELEQNLNKLPKDKQLVLVCKSGIRSKKALGILQKNGFTNASSMTGGIQEWTAFNYPVIEGKSCCSDPKSADCNPDGTCKPKVEKACCENPTSEKCKPDGTCKENVKCSDSEKTACKEKDKACCTTEKK